MQENSQSMPWWATTKPDPMGRPGFQNRVSLLGTADPVNRSFFYYDGDSLVETTDESEFNGASEGFYDVTRMDYFMDPLRKQTMMFDPWKQNNLLSIYDASINQAMDYEGVEDPSLRGKLRRWYNFDRPEGFGGVFDTVVSGLKFGSAFQDASGDLSGDILGLQSMFNAVGMIEIQDGDASKYDVPLAIKEAAKTGSSPMYAVPPDITHKLEARSSRFLRARMEFDPDFSPTKAWSGLTETQRRFLSSRGYTDKTWLATPETRANNPIDYFSSTETFIRQSVYQDQLAVFNNKSVVNWLPQYLASGTVNTMVNDIDNLTLTAITAPVGGWGGVAGKGLLSKLMGGTMNKLMVGTMNRIMPQWAKAVAQSGLTKSAIIEGAVIGGMQAVGGSEAQRQMTYATSGLFDEQEEPSYTMEALYGAAVGSAFVGLVHILPRMIKGAAVKGFTSLPAGAQTSVLSTPVVGHVINKWTHVDSLRRIMASVGADADQFYLFNNLSPSEAALLMNEENIGRGMIERTVESYYGMPLRDLKPLHRFLDRDFLHSAGVSYVDIAEQIKGVVVNSPEYLKMDPEKFAAILDDYITLSSATRIKGDIAAYRSSRAKQLNDLIQVKSGDIRHNVASPLTKRERRLLQDLEAPLAKVKGESDDAFRSRTFKRDLRRAQLQARSEFLPDLVKARETLHALLAEGITHKWVPGVIERLDRSIGSAGIKSTLDRQIFMVSSVIDEAAKDTGVRLKSLTDLGVKSDSVKSIEDLAKGLKKYKEEIRKTPETKNKKAHNEYLKIVKERYAEHMRILDEIAGKELFDYRGRGVPLGTISEFEEYFEKVGLVPETADSAGYSYLKDMEALKVAKVKRDAALRRAAKEPDTGKAHDMRVAAIEEFTSLRERTFLKYSPTDEKIVNAMDQASLARGVQSFNQLHPETQKTILSSLFDNIAHLGTEVNDSASALVRMVENTPFKQRISMILSQVATWPQTQKNTFLSHLAAVRGLAVLHDDSMSFASTFRVLSNPVSLRAASYGAIADALPVVQVGMRLKHKYGEAVKGSLNAHLSEIRQAGKSFSVAALPDDLKRYGESVVKDLTEWNAAMTAYFTNVLTSGHEVSLLKSGIDPTRYLPHRLPLDMTPEATRNFVDKFVKLRLSQFRDDTPLDLTTMEAKGWIVRLDNDRDFYVPDGSPLRMGDMTPENRVEAVKKIVSKGAKGLEELQRLQPPPSKKKAGAFPGVSDRTFRTKAEWLKNNEEIPVVSPSDARFDLGRHLSDRELVDAYWLADEMADKWTPDESLEFMMKFSDEIQNRFANKNWTHNVPGSAVDSGAEFAKISPWHDHVQRMWQKFNVLDEDEQAVLRAAYASVPKSVLAIRVLRNSDESVFAWASRDNLSITPSSLKNSASLFLHETGHWEVFRSPWMWDVSAAILNNFDTPTKVRLLREFGLVRPSDVLYALWNPDEFGAVLWDAFMSNKAMQTASTHPAVNFIRNLFDGTKRVLAMFGKKDKVSEIASLIRKAMDAPETPKNVIDNLMNIIEDSNIRASKNLQNAIEDATLGALGVHGFSIEGLLDVGGSSVGSLPLNRGAINLWAKAAQYKYMLGPANEALERELGKWKAAHGLTDQEMDTFVFVMGGLKGQIRAIEDANKDVAFKSRTSGSPGLANDIMHANGEKLQNMLDKAVSSVKKTFRTRSREDISDIVYNVYAELLDDTDGPAKFDSYVRTLEGSDQVDVKESFEAMSAALITQSKNRMKDMFRNEDRHAGILKKVAREEASDRELTAEETVEVLQDWASSATGEKKKTLMEYLSEEKKKAVETVALADSFLAQADKTLKEPEVPPVVVEGVQPKVTDPEVQKVIETIPLAASVLERAVEQGDLDTAAAVVAAAEDLTVALQAQEGPAKASEVSGTADTTPTQGSIPGPSTEPTAKAEPQGTSKGPPKGPPRGPRKAAGGSQPPKPPTGASLQGVDPEWFYERKRMLRDSKKGFVRIRDKWKLLGVLPSAVDLAKEYREGFKDPSGYTQEFQMLHPGKLGVQVAAERYVDRMTGRSSGRGSATDIRDIRAAVQRNSRPDSIEGLDRVFDDADFGTPEGMELAREFGMLNNLDSLVLNYARSSGTRINAHLMLKAMLKDLKYPGWNGEGITWSDLYDHVETSLKQVLATQADGSVKTLSADDNEVVNSTMDQFREKYLRAIGKFPLQDQDKTFNSITMLARNMTLGLLAPMTAPTISMVEVPLAIGRAFVMNPKQGAKMGLELVAHAFTSSPFGKMLGFKGSKGMMEDLITYAESLDASPLGKLTGEYEDIGMGLPETAKERLKIGWRRARADLMRDSSGRRDRDALLNFLVHGSGLVAQTSADLSSLRWGTELAKFMGANQAKRELIAFLPNLRRFRGLWDETKLGSTDSARERTIMGWLRETGIPYHVWNRAQRKGLLKPGVIEAFMEISPETGWGDKGAKAITLDLNRARNRLLDMDAEYRLSHLDTPRGYGELERREAVTAVHSYIEEGVNIFSPELRGIFRLDRHDQLTPWKRLMFFWQNYPMAFYNTNIQQAFRNQRVPMALANVMALYILELHARMSRDILMADSEEKRTQAVERWRRLVSLDPTDMSSELLQGAPMVPVLGHSQFLLSDITIPFANSMLDRQDQNRTFPKTFGSSPVMSVANRLYRNFVSNPINAAASGDSSRWSKTAEGVGQTVLDATPLVNSWGRMGWNVRKLMFSKGAITNPYDQLPRTVTDWVTTVQEDLAPKRERTSTVDGLFKTETRPQGERPSKVSPLDELRKPLG